MDLRQRLEAMLASGKDNALLRFTLGSECLKAGEAAQAAEHLRAALERDPGYSAAWKLLGTALAKSGAAGEARRAWERGVAAAESKGDKQAAREMGVFLKRLGKTPGSPGG